MYRIILHNFRPAWPLYHRRMRENKDGVWEQIVEDAKGVETPEFKLKKKLMKACLGIEIYLTKKNS